ncbi:MAG: hypothetical protein JO011_01490 [Ktedonobacteraceae bacterium]|nr:hypothetical protein [Ktedonobacteraceae bacterium]
MPNRDNFPLIFARLKAILELLAPPLVIEVDTSEQYSLHTPPSPAYPKGFFFGAVRIGKSYVSYHLMPVYMFPDLLDSLSDRLKKRMQGKSCFNFSVYDESMAEELGRLTSASIERFRQRPLT